MLAEHYYGTSPGGDSGPDLEAVLDLMARARPAWHAAALCTEYPAVDFFDPKDTAAAVAICRRCSVATDVAPTPARTARRPACGPAWPWTRRGAHSGPGAES